MPDTDADTLVRPDAPMADPTGGDKATLDSLVGLKRQEVGEQDRLRGERTSLMNRDQRRVEQQFEATGIQPGEFRKWDAEAESKKHSTDPIAAFGSLGSVFGMIASAFTHAPMENALNASAAAMHAIKAGDEKEYERAHTAWKENTDLTFKRHTLQRESYLDAIRLMDTDMQVGDAKARMLAAKYGDRQSLLLLEAGMSKEWIELQERRNDAAVKGMAARNALLENGFQNEVIRKGIEQNDKIEDPQQKAAANLALVRDALRSQGIKDIDSQGLALKNAESIRKNGRPLNSEEWLETVKAISEARSRRFLSPDQEFLQKFDAENPGATSEQRTEAFGNWKKGQRQQPRKNADQEFISRFYDEKPEATVEEFTKAFDEFKRGQKPPPAAGALTTGKVNAATLEGVKADVRNEHPDWSEGQVGLESEKRFKQAAASPVTGNQRLKEEAHIDQFENSIKTIDKTLKVLETHRGAAGIAGKVMRVEERLSNILGSNNTERVQMMREIELLRAMAPQLLLDRSGRPLSAEAAHTNDIVAGLSAGDTGVNTVRALRDLKTRYEAMMKGAEKRLEGTWEPPSTRNSPPAGGAKPWMRDPIDKRSEIAPSEEAA